MNREILFRGKRTDNGEWVEGYLVKQYGANEIYLPNGTDNEGFDRYSVDISTIGQYTGLTDRNGVKIFEGDIVKLSDGYAFPIIFKDGCFLIACGDSALPLALFKEREVIGNIHDNPDLLGGVTNA